MTLYITPLSLDSVRLITKSAISQFNEVTFIKEGSFKLDLDATIIPDWTIVRLGYINFKCREEAHNSYLELNGELTPLGQKVLDCVSHGFVWSTEDQCISYPATKTWLSHVLQSTKTHGILEKIYHFLTKYDSIDDDFRRIKSQFLLYKITANLIVYKDHRILVPPSFSSYYAIVRSCWQYPYLYEYHFLPRQCDLSEELLFDC